MRPRDGDLTRSAIKIESGSLFIVAEIQQSCPLPAWQILVQPSQRWGDGCSLSLSSGEQDRREACGREPALPSLLTFDSSTHSSCWFPISSWLKPFLRQLERKWILESDLNSNSTVVMFYLWDSEGVTSCICKMAIMILVF